MNHTFAIYWPQVSFIAQNGNILDNFNLTDKDNKDILHRISAVLRLNSKDNIILFNEQYNLSCSIINVTKKNITLEIKSIDLNINLKPYITWLLPILKREAYEEAIYALSELGVNQIQPIITQKIYSKSRAWGSEKDISRAKKIIIAASEQSKNYYLPELLPVKTLDQYLDYLSNQVNNQNLEIQKVFFDYQGLGLSSIINTLKLENPTKIIALSGPEGDLTEPEKAQLSKYNFMFCQLTPTILRAQQALVVGLGALRSLL